ncbi:MAG TPA: hypothetical protein VK171_11795 [Fimbriimonas sp.]|nr:hypothetical protein [Fimbriimonas sp.]
MNLNQSCQKFPVAGGVNNSDEIQNALFNELKALREARCALQMSSEPDETIAAKRVLIGLEFARIRANINRAEDRRME